MMNNSPRTYAEDEALTRYPDPGSPGPLDFMAPPEYVAECEREAFTAGVAWGSEQQQKRINDLLAQCAQLRRNNSEATRKLSELQAEYDEAYRELQNRIMNPGYDF